MIEARLSRFENIHRNKETLPTQYLTIPDTSSHINENEESWCLETLIKSQFHRTNLNLTNSKPWTNWQVFHSMRLNLNVNVTLIPNLVDSVPIFKSIWTPVYLPNLG